MPSSRSSIDSPLAVEVELRKEKASALRRVGDRLEKLIGELAGLERELHALTGLKRAERMAKYQQLRAEAEHQRWCLIVQREAMGLWNHSEVDLMYPIPPQAQ